jgi:uroporphyrinogen-III synthase
MKRLLSTRVLSGAHLARLESAGWEVEQYDSISIEYIPTPVSPKGHLLVFTSKNGVEGFLKSFPGSDFSGFQSLCVGRRAGERLREHGLEVLQMAPTARELALRIQERFSGDSFVYYCGNRRLDFIPDTLDSLGAAWQEAVVYTTGLNPRHFTTRPDAILFFSPSGVESYLAGNDIGHAWGYCIGPTTADRLRHHTDRVLCARTPDVESLIDLAQAQTHPLNH